MNRVSNRDPFLLLQLGSKKRWVPIAYERCSRLQELLDNGKVLTEGYEK